MPGFLKSRQNISAYAYVLKALQINNCSFLIYLQGIFIKTYNLGTLKSLIDKMWIFVIYLGKKLVT